MKSTISKKGFTLIELLIVIAIIAVLALAFVPSLMKAPAKSRDTQRTTAITKIANFLTTESLANATFPASDCISSADDKIGVDDTISKLINDNIADFGGVFPVDPKSGNKSTGAGKECDAQYGYINFANTVNNYSAVVYAAVENPEAGNVLCSSLKDSEAPKLTPGKVEVAVDGTGAVTSAVCFAALIQ